MAIFNIWEVSLDGTPNFYYIHELFSPSFVASQLFLCLFWISLWLKNRCQQHPCFKNMCKIAQSSKNSDANAQHFLSDLLTHSWFFLRTTPMISGPTTNTLSYHYTKYDLLCLIIFSIVITLSCSTLIFNSLIISVGDECVATFLVATSFLLLSLLTLFFIFLLKLDLCM